jgi:hypothetical protein
VARINNLGSLVVAMERFCKSWNSQIWNRQSWFGDLVVLAFLVVQFLDGAFTYLGVSIWGPGIEANPIVSQAVSVAGLGAGLAGAKLVAVGFGIALHLSQAHRAIALLTVIYMALAILPWTALFLLE